MAEAAARGIVDFSEAKLSDPRWHRRIRFLLMGMGRIRRRELLEKAHDNHCAMLGIAKLSEDGLKGVEERCHDLLEQLCQAYMPWEQRDKEDREKEEARSLRSGWKNKFGDLDDPEVRKRVDDFAAAMLAQANQSAQQAVKASSSTLFNKDTAAAF